MANGKPIRPDGHFALLIDGLTYLSWSFKAAARRASMIAGTSPKSVTRTCARPNHAQAREFAEAWVADAKALLDAGRWHAAYYLAGYAVECGLKACILAHIDNTGIIFQDKKFAERCFTHDIEALVKAADLETTRGIDIAATPELGLNWQVVKDWSVDVRYQARSEPEARRLYKAITDSANRVLPWIRARW